jgi:hypothetical protein
VRVTGIILVLIGLVAGAICLVVLNDPANPNREAPLTNDGQVQRPSMVVPLTVCGAAVIIGGAMYMFGGRSYKVSNNPQVRN